MFESESVYLVRLGEQQLGHEHTVRDQFQPSKAEGRHVAWLHDRICIATRTHMRALTNCPVCVANCEPNNDEPEGHQELPLYGLWETLGSQELHHPQRKEAIVGSLMEVALPRFGIVHQHANNRVDRIGKQ